MTLIHLWNMCYNYWLKLQELKSYGKEDRIPQRITETEESIKVLTSEIYLKISELRKLKNAINNPK
ncbi:hypothetical protein [Flavobacterium sp. 5]|uniref:hypothetical protein n=1 Tax=Flavobacterium sp. 5 TaxID=2035199 RepID=UPI000CB73EB2|nr:hypothetical protein [Flavobacterium sp. 5]PKB18366.1 hypothetical protein CLU82_3641 [Flavobacterium sp. 5]